MTDNLTTIMAVLEHHNLITDICNTLHTSGFHTCEHNFIRGYLEALADNGSIHRVRLGKNRYAYSVSDSVECVNRRCPGCWKHITIFDSSIGDTIKCISCGIDIEVCTSLSKGVVLKKKDNEVP